ncbi:hypothetical protein BH24ACI5_BH24ACI5_16810 [soil metagenome]
MGILSKFLAPVIFSRAGAGENASRLDEARRMGRFLVASALSLTLLATVVAALAHEQVFALLVAPEYRGVSWLLPLQVLGSGLFAASQAASMLSMLAANSRALLTPKIASAVLGTGLNVLAAWQYGLTGVVYAGVLYGAISPRGSSKSDRRSRGNRSLEPVRDLIRGGRQSPVIRALVIVGSIGHVHDHGGSVADVLHAVPDARRHDDELRTMLAQQQFEDTSVM